MQTKENWFIFSASRCICIYTIKIKSVNSQNKSTQYNTMLLKIKIKCLRVEMINNRINKLVEEY